MTQGTPMLAWEDRKDTYLPALDSSEERRAAEEKLQVIAKGKSCRVCRKMVLVVPKYNYDTRRMEFFLKCVGCWPEAPQLYKPKSPGQIYRETGIGDAITIQNELRRLNKLGMEDQKLSTIQRQGLGIELLQPLDIEGVKTRIFMVQYVASILKEGVDYGHIPGTRGNGKSLLKPGADKFRMALNIPFRMVEVETMEDEEKKKTSWPKKGGPAVTRHWIRAKYEAKCEVNGQVFGSIIRTCDSFEERWNGWDPDMLPDLVAERAQKRAYVELIKMISGVSGEYQESMEYVDPEDLKTVSGKVVDRSTGEIQTPPTPEEPSDFGRYADWANSCPIPEHEGALWRKGDYPPNHKLPAGSKFRNCYFKNVTSDEAKGILGGDAEFKEWGKANIPGQVWNEMPWQDELLTLNAIWEEKNPPATTEAPSEGEGEGEAALPF